MVGIAAFRKGIMVALVVLLIAAAILAGISVHRALAQGPVGGRLTIGQIWVEGCLPPNSPDAPCQPASTEYLLERFKIGMFPEPEDVPSQPDTYCWDYPAYWTCYCPTQQYWELWCHRCCNDPDYCPTGCCDTYCWWVEAGSCSCQ